MSIILNKNLYNKIKEKIYSENPKHSAYRSMQLVKEYKKAGGEYSGNNERQTTKWLNQKWTDANEYYHNNKIIPCGSQDTIEKYNEYPLCRPLSILERLTSKDLKKLIDAKNKLKNKSLITSKILNTNEYNIKDTVSGSGSDFIHQLNEIGLSPSKYLNEAKKEAKKNGYDPKNLFLSDKKNYKLMYLNNHFGRVNYNDFIIWSHLEKKGLVPFGYANKKRNTYHKSHGNIHGDWVNNKNSPNMLSLNINW